MINSYKIMFTMTLMFSTFLTICANSWLGMWMGLEINLMSFIPLISSKTQRSTEASMKYFITQASASVVLMISILYMTMKLTTSSNLLMSVLPETLMLSAILLKMGCAPFHFWFPEIVDGLSWLNVCLLMTWQKVAPMIMSMYTLISGKLLILSIMSSILIGSLMGLGQTSMRKILAYSSINHMGWMLSAIMLTESLWLIYFIVYVLTNTAIILSLTKKNVNKITQMNCLFNNTPENKIFFSMNLMSLGGLPPFIGFIPKWLTIQMLVETKMIIVTITMIMTTMITLYYYLRISMSLMMISHNYSNKINNSKYLPKQWIMVCNCILISLMSLTTLALNWM
uniref:NADH dehydrogenase subunit 2 n=1 Tax=Cantonius szechuanensis TaxID=3045900 RepID=UPI00257A8D1E|nr:NADH dehydrogenase subunit 2 [Cantonius szechuanensis]WHE42521.1 NADH dehydrogenase subunit 2 [Cantonius szechuanensis]